MNTFVIIATFLSIVLAFKPLLLVYIHPAILLCIGILYFFMMAEDFIYETVDMRIWFLLFLCMQIYVSFSKRFYLEYIIGMLLFSVLFSLSWKIIPSNDTNSEAKKSNLQLQLGFLPSIGIAIGIWYILKDYIPVPEVDIVIISTTPFFIILFICFFLFVCYRESKLSIAEKKALTIQYGMGGGDVWVCGAWLAFLSFKNFIVVMFIASWIHILLYSIYYFFQKSGELNEIEK